MQYKSIRGFNDILPEECASRQRIEDASRRTFELAGYREIRTPILEETALFVKGVGEGTDIVTKEMFSFTDRGERDITLRPEGTAPIVRAYLENNIYKTKPFQKLYYIGPMFRAERPQAGRLRQFYQIGLEAIGSGVPAMDAEVISVLVKLLDSIGVKNYELKLNNPGCAEDKKKLSGSLKELLSKKPTINLVCEDCKKRIAVNPLRVLDCKNESCKTAVREAFKEIDFLCDGCKDSFAMIRALLDRAKISYAIDPYIVRGLDYYTGAVFEVVQNSLGSQNAIAAGGRYDDLISDMGGPKTGACGFAIGLDRIVMALGEKTKDAEGKLGQDVFIATLGKQAAEEVFAIMKALREAGISCDIDYESRSLKGQMRAADDAGSKFVLIIGDDELAKKEATLRNMATKEQSNVKFDSIVDTLVKGLRFKVES